MITLLDQLAECKKEPEYIKARAEASEAIAKAECKNGVRHVELAKLKYMCRPFTHTIEIVDDECPDSYHVISASNLEGYKEYYCGKTIDYMQIDTYEEPFSISDSYCKVIPEL